MITDKIYMAIIIEIVLQALILIGIIVGIILVKLKPKGTANSFNTPSADPQAYYTNSVNQNPYNGYSSRVTYCRNCAGEYDASMRVCPHCGTPR